MIKLSDDKIKIFFYFNKNHFYKINISKLFNVIMKNNNNYYLKFKKINECCNNNNYLEIINNILIFDEEIDKAICILKKINKLKLFF